MLNKVILIGYLGADPESKTMPSGGEVVNIRVATSESYTEKAKRKQIKSKSYVEYKGIDGF